MVTIATNMAGRGTDILLGGNSEFMARQDLVKKAQARAVSAAEGAISPTAGPEWSAFYYASQEFETTKEAWDAAIASHLETAQVEHESVVAAEACTSSAPSATSPAAWTTSFAAAPDARAIPAARVSSSRSKTTSCASSPASGSAPSSSASAWKRASHREPHDLQPHRGRAEGRRNPEL